MNGDLTKKHEGLRLWVYTDTAGKKTIGYGFNLQAAGARDLCARFGLDFDALFNGKSRLAPDQAEAIFEYQFNQVLIQASLLFPNFSTMPANVQAVIADLIFNMGLPTFLEFHQTIAALKAGFWATAASDLKDSLWYSEVGTRGVEDVELLQNASRTVSSDGAPFQLNT